MSGREVPPGPARRPAHLRQEPPSRAAPRARGRSRPFAVALGVVVVAGAGIGIGVRLALRSSPQGSPTAHPRSAIPHRTATTTSGARGTASRSGAAGTAGGGEAVAGGHRRTTPPSATSTTAPRATAPPATPATASTLAAPATTALEPTTTAPAAAATTATLPTSSILVEVLNGSGVGGIAAATARELRAAGFLINGTGNASSFEHVDNVAEYSAGSLTAAETVSSYLTGTTRLAVVRGLANDEVYLVLGSSFRGLIAY